MSMKKGYCPKCKTNDEKKRVFEVNSEAKVCYCPVCMSEYAPKTVIKAYKDLIDDKIGYGYYVLNVRKKYKKAYKTFANVLEFEQDNATALAGRLVSLIRLSTLRKVYFSDALALLKIEKYRFSLVSNKQIYIKLLTSLNVAAEEYHHNLSKRLTFKGYFYDNECLNLFVIRLREIKEFEEYLLKEFVGLEDEGNSTLITKQIAMIEKAIHAHLYTAEGVMKEFKNFDEFNRPVFVSIVDKNKKPLSKIHLRTLDMENKTLRKIPNSMFNKDHKKRALFISLAIVCISSVIVSTILYILGAITASMSQKAIMFIIASVLLLLAIAFVLISLYVKKVIKIKIKKKHSSA